MKWLLMLVWLAASSCTVQDTGKVKLRFWAMGAEGEKVKPLIEKFQQEYPDIEVAVQAIPWGAAYEKLLTAYAGQALPDVLQLGNTWIPQFASLEAILPLDAYIAGSAVVYPEAYFEGIWNTNIIGEKVYGVPWYVDTRLLFYRSDILADAGYPNPPQTWDEWKDVSRAIVAKTDSKYAAFFSLIFNDWQIPVILILSNGGKILRDNFQYGAFDDPRTLEALSFYIDFFRQGLVPRTMTEFANIYQGFERGDMAMMITGPWNIAEMRLRAPELAGRWTTAPMPVSSPAAGAANRPTARVPQAPLKACTATAPTGSSIFHTRSMSTSAYTSTGPATRPMARAPAGVTLAVPAVSGVTGSVPRLACFAS